jgi:hypothetical protein
MKFWQATFAAAVCAGAASAEAAFHQWAIKEVFTNADGSVQFVEFFTTAPGEGFLNTHNIVITSDGVAKTATFNHDLSGSTANKHFLLATSGFGSIPGGVTPDYTATSGNLFNPNAANITFDFAHGFDILQVMGSQIPKDGVNSLHDADTTYLGPDVLSTGPNSPTNFAGATGNLGGGGGTPGDFDGNGMVNGADLAVWRTNFGDTTATLSQGDADADGDVDGRDFLVWQRNVGPAAAMPAVNAVPEPAASLLSLLTAAALLNLRRSSRRMTTGEPEA